MTVAIIDTDSHLSEPKDLWTSRMPQRWQDLAPRVVSGDDGVEVWQIGDKRMLPAGATTMAGWSEFPPKHPPKMELADPGGYDPRQRVARLDEYGIDRQLLYPNLLGFFAATFMGMDEPELMKACVRAYNDFVADFSAEGDHRFVPLAALPYWSVEDCVAELERCYEAGHRGIVFPPDPTKVGLPALSDPHWDPVFEVAQGLELSVNLHIGFGAFTDQNAGDAVGEQGRSGYARNGTLLFMGNVESITELCMSGVCSRFPRLKFVSVESGFGYLPFLCESMDWQWINAGKRHHNPDEPMPSEVFHRQIFATFWFEQGLRGLEDFEDNAMFSTDYPHPTSLAPGPNSDSDYPSVMAERALSGRSEELVAKVLHRNAAHVYNLD